MYYFRFLDPILAIRHLNFHAEGINKLTALNVNKFVDVSISY